jgi:hypothetical protein
MVVGRSLLYNVLVIIFILFAIYGRLISKVSYSQSTIIHSNAKKAWEKISNVKNYTDWKPFYSKIEQIDESGYISVTLF